MSTGMGISGKGRWQLVLPAAVALALGLGVLAALWIFARGLALLVLAVTLAAAVLPAVSWLERWLRRSLAVVLAYLVVFGGTAFAMYLVAPSLLGHLSQLGDRVPEMIDRLSRAQHVLPLGSGALRRMLQDVVPRILAASSSLASAGVDVLVVVFLSLYLLLEAPHGMGALLRVLPVAHRRRVLRVLSRMGREMGGYVRGAAINGVVVGGLTWATLMVLGVEFSLPLAVLALFGELLPYVGPIVAAVPAVAIALTQSSTLAVAVVIAYVSIQQIEGHVLTPLIMHTQTSLPPALVVVALTMGYTAGGILGAITAIPLFAAGRVLVSRVAAPYLRCRRMEAHGVHARA